MVDLSPSYMVSQSDAILTGTITSAESRWNEDKTGIETIVSFSVNNMLAGDLSAPQVMVFEGGTVGEITQTVTHVPIFFPGEEVGLFLKQQPDGSYQTVGLSQGVVHFYKHSVTTKRSPIDAEEMGVVTQDFFKQAVNAVLDGDETATWIIQPAFPEPIGTAEMTIDSLSPTTASAGTRTAITITGSGFGTKASRESYADFAFYFVTDSGTDYWIYGTGWVPGSGWQDFNPDAIVSWSDTQVVCNVPTGTAYRGYYYRGSASSGPVYILHDDGSTEFGPYSLSVPFGWSRIKWAGTSPVVPYYVNPLSSDALTAVQAASSTWTGVQGSSFVYEYAGPTTATDLSRNGKNEIMWTSTVPAGVLAQASTWSSGSTILETDIRFNTQYSWSTNPGSGQYDIESIALHELGHWVGLADLYGNLAGYPSDTSKVMYGRGGAGESKRTLHSGDRDGIRYIYPGVSPTPPTPAFTASPTTGTAPLTVQFSDQSTNTPTSWKWEYSTGGAWTQFSTSKNPSYQFISAGTYSIRLTATNAGGSNTLIWDDYIVVTAHSPQTSGINVIAAPGDTVFRGEGGLDIVATGAVVGDTIAWFAAGSDPRFDSPAATKVIGSTTHFYVATSMQVGLWYDLHTRTQRFIVADPSLDIKILDTSGNIKNDGIISKGEVLRFRIDSNLDAFIQRNTDPASTGAPVTVKVTDPLGVVYTSLIDDTGFINPLAVNIVSNPQLITGVFWATGIWDTGNSIYIPGTYTVTVSCNANGMNDNYDIVGKTISRTYSITVAEDDLIITANTDTVIRGNDFAVTITGRPNTAYALWTKGTSTLAVNEVPQIKAGQQGVHLDAGVGSPGNIVGNYIFTTGQTVGGDTPNGIVANSPFYAEVTTNNAGVRTVGFETMATTQDQTFTIRVQEPVPLAYGPLFDEVEVSVALPPTPAPVANFTATPTTGDAPLTVQFTDQSTNTPASWKWEYNTTGSGWTEFSTSQHPSYQFTSAGMYSIRLTATNAGGSDSETKVDYITVTDVPVTSTYGVYRNGWWILKDGTRTNYGTPTDIPVVVDGKIGVYRNGLWIIKGVDERVRWGTPTDIPVVVDGTIGVYRNGWWLLKDGTREQFGTPTDKPVVVDGKIGVYRNGLWIIKGVDERVRWGTPTDIPVVVDGKIGVYRNGFWLIKDGVREQYGLPSDIPVAEFDR